MKYNDNGLWKTLNVKVTDTLPVGTIIPYAGTTIPSNYMLCEGQALSRIEYDILFSAIGTTYGVGDGTTTFNLPNLKGRVITGIDSNDTDFDVLGKTGGSKELQEHTHKIYVANSTNSAGSQYTGIAFVNGASLTNNGELIDTSKTGDGDSENLQPYIVLNYVIKVLDAPATGIRSETLPVGTEVDFDGSVENIPVGWEQVEEVVLRKALTASASGTAGTGWQNLGNLYLDLTPGTWYVKANANYTTSGNGIGYNKCCLSFSSNGGATYDRLDSTADMCADINTPYTTVHSLSCIVTVTETTRIYLLEAYAYTGTNLTLTLNYDTNPLAGGPSFIEARKLN